MTRIHYFITVMYPVQSSPEMIFGNIKSLLHVYEACKQVFAHSTCMKLQGPQNP